MIGSFAYPSFNTINESLYKLIGYDYNLKNILRVIYSLSFVIHRPNFTRDTQAASNCSTDFFNARGQAVNNYYRLLGILVEN
ncbi:hypothetical protein SAMN05518848_103522 [Paenibacillus sp. PDC88]|nr:hypothetical protein SAMN05518848_103522 [Paenibacillus sp. PDC88]